METGVSYSAADYIGLLQMQTHPEGGYYVPTYRSTEQVPAAALPPRFGGDRSFSTGIYFLLEGGDFSSFHRIASDELWHFYDGCGLEIFVIHPDGRGVVLRLGR
ncbi:MAG TPA: cupin domain-containing protein, partial [Lacibacter sp.]|nr:cupin domain-containing protein [Lacibacter sp.]